MHPKGTPMNLVSKLLMNSLYGKFGMKVEQSVVEIFDKTDNEQMKLYNETLETFGDTIHDILEIGESFIVIRNDLSKFLYDERNDLYHGIDVNIPIAAAITAGGRIHMSEFKNNPNYDLYYSDTDSIVIDKKLPDNLISDELGKFKLEHEITHAFFLAPKVYGLITPDNKEIIKIKGLSADAIKDKHYIDLEFLLRKDAILDIKQNKWYKDLFRGEISIEDTTYQLKLTHNKRKPIYQLQESTGYEYFVDTVPFRYDELEDHSNNDNSNK